MVYNTKRLDFVKPLKQRSFYMEKQILMGQLMDLRMDLADIYQEAQVEKELVKKIDNCQEKINAEKIEIANGYKSLMSVFPFTVNEIGQFCAIDVANEKYLACIKKEVELFGGDKADYLEKLSAEMKQDGEPNVETVKVAHQLVETFDCDQVKVRKHPEIKKIQESSFPKTKTARNTLGLILSVLLIILASVAGVIIRRVIFVNANIKGSFEDTFGSGIFWFIVAGVIGLGLSGGLRIYALYEDGVKKNHWGVAPTIVCNVAISVASVLVMSVRLRGVYWDAVAAQSPFILLGGVVGFMLHRAQNARKRDYTGYTKFRRSFVVGCNTYISKYDGYLKSQKKRYLEIGQLQDKEKEYAKNRVETAKRLGEKCEQVGENHTVLKSSDYAHLDYVLYTLYTNRADSIKEGLMLLDRELQTKRLEESNAQIGEYLANNLQNMGAEISKGMGELAQRIEQSADKTRIAVAQASKQIGDKISNAISSSAYSSAIMVSGAMMAAAYESRKPRIYN